MNRSPTESRRKLRHFARNLIELLDRDAPLVVVKCQWERVLEHGSNLFDEVIYSVGETPELPRELPHD